MADSTEDAYEDVFIEGLADMVGDKTPVIDYETAKVPNRNIEMITDVLKGVRVGDRVNIVFGIPDLKVSRECTVVGIKGERSDRTPEIDWTHTVELEGPEGDDTNGLMYRIGVGDDDFEPWYVISYPYNKSLNMIDDDNSWGHGWVVDAHLITKPAEK